MLIWKREGTRERESETIVAEEEGKRDLDEANSKRDVLLIILTPGVRLNERRSQTHEAQCKFNYREKGRQAAGQRGERTTTKRAKPMLSLPLYAAAGYASCYERDWTR